MLPSFTGLSFDLIYKIRTFLASCLEWILPKTDRSPSVRLQQVWPLSLVGLQQERNHATCKKKRRFPRSGKALLLHLSRNFFDTTSQPRWQITPERLVKDG